MLRSQVERRMPFYRNTKANSSRAAALLMLFCAIGLLAAPFNYRGVGFVSRLLSRIVRPAYVQVLLDDATPLQINLLDYYWVRLIFTGYTYEPELEGFLRRHLPGRFAFIDCGANIGYWSSAVSSWRRGGHVVAIEASPSTFALLRRNAELVGCRYRVVNRALSDVAGETVAFVPAGDHHASAHVLRDGETAGTTVSVTTTTLDEVIKAVPPGLPLVLKIDVEGAEIATIRGASESLAGRDAIIIYECHASDRSSETTRYLLQTGEYRIYGIEGDIVEITSAEQATRYKTERKGYNFVAVKPSFDPLVGRSQDDGERA
jgi:FkbM family methyltransferase